MSEQVKRYKAWEADRMFMDDTEVVLATKYDALQAECERLRHQREMLGAGITKISTAAGITCESAVVSGPMLLLIAADILEVVASLRSELAAIKAQEPVSDDHIRDVFMRNGFTIKGDQTDLKPYVFAAARDLLASVSAVNPQLTTEPE